MGKWRLADDGVSHVNVYSKGKTTLGRSLSNFADTPFTHPEYGEFRTVEGYWYWTMTGDERLRSVRGWEAKALGKELPLLRAHPSVEELRTTYAAKLSAHPQIAAALRECGLPLAHYYTYGDKIVEPAEWQWTATLWEEFR